MAVTTVIMIILSISALAILVYFFSSQSERLEDTVRSQNSESNVDEVVVLCNGFARRDAGFAFCCERQKIVFGEGRSDEKMTCSEAKTEGWAAGRIENYSCSRFSCK